MMDAYLNEKEVPTTQSFDFWKYMMKKALLKSDEFEIRCREEEDLAEETGCLFADEKEKGNTGEKIYRGRVSDAFAKAVLNHYLDENEALIWFSLFLKEKGKILFSSEHYGTELYWFGVKREQKKQIEDLKNKFREILRVDFFPSVF